MIDRLKREAAAAWIGLTGAAARARRQLYGGRHGLRILAFHDTPPSHFDAFRRLVDWVREALEPVGPEAAAAINEGRSTARSRDQALFTFDDGFESNFAAAEYLAKCGIRGIFFVVPTFLDRTMDEYVAWNHAKGVEAFRFRTDGSLRGLSHAQVKEMVAMGHLIAGHNFAHRDLGKLTQPADLAYEIDRAADAAAEFMGRPCEDFAIGFGQPRHATPEALAHLQRRCKRVYSIVRGLNVPGLTPRLLLRDNISLKHPFSFQKAALRGGVDFQWAPKINQLKQIGGVLPPAQPAIA
jgi:peptidoglycan/xylan/chitin deacetylase (PgdA/CDA1 family)